MLHDDISVLMAPSEGQTVQTADPISKRDERLMPASHVHVRTLKYMVNIGTLILGNSKREKCDKKRF